MYRILEILFFLYSLVYSVSFIKYEIKAKRNFSAAGMLLLILCTIVLLFTIL